LTLGVTGSLDNLCQTGQNIHFDIKTLRNKQKRKKQMLAVLVDAFQGNFGFIIAFDQKTINTKLAPQSV